MKLAIRIIKSKPNLSAIGNEIPSCPQKKKTNAKLNMHNWCLGPFLRYIWEERGSESVSLKDFSNQVAQEHRVNLIRDIQMHSVLRQRLFERRP